MTARVLVVDDIPTNVKLLEARLVAEYFDVVTASSGKEALEICANEAIDLVLLDVMMPEMDGFEVCRRLKASADTVHIPVVMVTALDQPSDRVTGLEAGADDFLNKPVDEVQLMARVKSLVRVKSLTDELRTRALTVQQIAVEDAARAIESITAECGSILVVDTDKRHGERLAKALEPAHNVDIITEPTDAVHQVAQKSYETIIVSMAMGETDPLRIYSQLRTLEQSRMVPIILVAEESDREKVVRGLDIGVNDFIMRPVDHNELAARVKTQIRRYRYTQEVNSSFNQTVQLAVIDELTGLYNRRYFDRHLGLMLSKAQEQDRHLALMILDIDFFKTVNDKSGHDAGDAVLKEFALRLQRNIRGIDLACRYGGEEFVVLMPDTDLNQAKNVAERVRQSIADQKFETGEGPALAITVSAGVAFREGGSDTPESILKRADIALYRAKNEGRNRIIYDAA